MLFTLANILIVLVALLHGSFIVLEMFLWNTPTGYKAFRIKPEFAEKTAALAANQGLYNGFLVAGLIWGYFHSSAGFNIHVFFLSCIIVAGVFGACTVNRLIFWVQAFPAIIALVLLFLAQSA